MTPALLADKIEAKVREYDHVSFAELAREYPDHFLNGELAYLVADNIMIWSGMSATGADAIDLVRSRKTTTIEPTSTLTYLIDGMGQKAPIAKSVRKYKKMHWLPVVICRKPTIQ